MYAIFNAVEDILLGLDYKQEELVKTIDSLSFLPALDKPLAPHSDLS